MRSPASFSRLQIALHRIVAGLVAAQFLVHDGIAAAWRATMRGAEVPGAAAWFGGLREASEVHEGLAPALLALTGPHVAAALFHHVVLRTDVLVRLRRPSA